MTDKTATQNLTRTQPGDSLISQGVHLGTLANEIDARLGSHAFDLARSQVPPMVVLHATVPRTYQLFSDIENSTLIWDVVELDTANLVDLSLNAKEVNITSNGIWAAGGYAACSGVSTGNYFSLAVEIAGSENENRGRDGGFADGVLAHVHYEDQVTNAPRTAFCTAGYSTVGVGITSLVVLEAWMWVYKVRDL